MTNSLKTLYSGVYRHYKGPLYQVIGYSHNASDDNKPQVLYIGLELDEAKTGPRFATRDADEFLSWVHEDGSVCTYRHVVDGCAVSEPRFRYLGPSYLGKKSNNYL